MMNTEQIYAASIAVQYALITSRKAIALRKLHRKATQVPRCVTAAMGFGAFALMIVGTAVMETNLILGIGLDCLSLCLLAALPFLYRKLWERAKGIYAWDVVTLAKQVWDEGT